MSTKRTATRLLKEWAPGLLTLAGALAGSVIGFLYSWHLLKEASQIIEAEMKQEIKLLVTRYDLLDLERNAAKLELAKADLLTCKTLLVYDDFPVKKLKPDEEDELLEDATMGQVEDWDGSALRLIVDKMRGRPAPENPTALQRQIIDATKGEVGKLEVWAMINECEKILDTAEEKLKPQREELQAQIAALKENIKVTKSQYETK